MPTTQGNWHERYCAAFEYAHNYLRLQSWLLGRFAHAYADITDDEVWTLSMFWDSWDNGEFEPDNMGQYHHRSWFEQLPKRVA